MEHRFASKRDLIRAFAGAMNLISPEVANHHEKVSFLAWRLADILGKDEDQKKTVFYTGLLHDIGGILQRGNLSLADVMWRQMHRRSLCTGHPFVLENNTK